MLAAASAICDSHTTGLMRAMSVDQPTGDRREFLRATAAAGAGLVMGSGMMTKLEAYGANVPAAGEPLFKISLAEWSIHRTLFAKDAKMTNLDFPAYAKRECGIDAVEYVNQFWMDKAKDEKYLAELKKRCSDEGVTSVLIMCDSEGFLGDPDEAKRNKAVENHHKWADAAKYLGCHSIRVNAHSAGSREEQAKLAADGLRQLSEYAAPLKINVIVENHGGLSSDGGWLSGVIKSVGLPNCGTLPDFGNFNLGNGQEYDRYKGTEELMPYAKGVSAKSYAFDAQGNETKIDYPRIMKIVVAAGYHGRVGIEFEGEGDEKAGILATKKLLERILAEMTAG
jgi:sugar phosphate isomerase/epimerase